jgi:hypothetical protein
VLGCLRNPYQPTLELHERALALGVDSRLVPSKPWDLLLWLSSAGFIIVGLWTVWQKLQGIITAAQ